jgi:putative DNA primase/helicase
MSIELSTRFIELLYGDKPSQKYILVWSMQGRISKWFRSIDYAIKYIDSVNKRKINGKLDTNRDLYLGCCLSSKDFGPNRRCLANDVTAIGGLWIDIDVEGTNHKGKKRYPKTMQEAIKIANSLPLKPSVILNTGGGIHAWWKLAEIQEIDSTEMLDYVTKTVAQWQLTLQYHASLKKYDIDSTHDLARVMRIPGTYNCKGKEPKLITIIEENDNAFELEDFEQYFPKEMEKQFKEVTEVKARKKDGLPNVVIDINAGLDPEKWSLAVQSFPKLQSLFDHEKHAVKHFKDNSLSSIDLSLASTLVNIGWNDQDIANVITAHRLKYDPNDHKIRSGRIDYLQYTIQRAHVKLVKNNAQDRINDMSDFGDKPTTKEEIVVYRNTILKNLSDRFGVEFTDIIEFRSDPPEYRICFKGNRFVQFHSIDELLRPIKFRNAIAQGVKIVINVPDGKNWLNISQQILDASREMDVGAESTEAGAIKTWVIGYLSSKRINDDPGDAVRRKSPFHKSIGGTEYICMFGEDFKEWLFRIRGERVSSRRIGIMLSNVLMATNGSVRISGDKVASVWKIPKANLSGVE